MEGNTGKRQSEEENLVMLKRLHLVEFDLRLCWLILWWSGRWSPLVCPDLCRSGRWSPLVDFHPVSTITLPETRTHTQTC